VSRLVLVRHAHAAAGWHEDPDPALDAVGRAQADALGLTLAPMGPLPIVVSPLRRTRETAGVLERTWGVEARVEPGVGEIRAPGVNLAGVGLTSRADLEGRAAWLREVARGSWSAQDGALLRWRSEFLAVLATIDEASVIVTHFFGINAAVGAATGNDRLVSFHPDHCSRTVVDNDGGHLRLIELGSVRATDVR
jgi:broad specificity phosphatase PhoE